uniref:Uncharacterized protein n=1 Tax=Lepeophtheirus salmonis TaxID=72036 RepID=A0A0K2USP6_LEPSM
MLCKKYKLVFVGTGFIPENPTFLTLLQNH